MNTLTTRPEEEQEKTVIKPLVDIRENEKEIRLEAEMPGLDRESVDLQLFGDELIVKGSRKEEKIPEGYATLHRERCPYEYSRTFVLGNDVSREGIDAKYENGILTVIIPKSEASQPRRIKIA